MADALPGGPELEAAIWRLYRDFFDMAERRRRWSIRDDIPWDQCNPRLDPALADVVESFCAVELYLPDYSAKILPVVRSSQGRAWFYANWGYEESKHSLVLGDWLLKSGNRTDEQMADLEARLFQHEWNLPHDSALGMLVYAMVQERATALNYRNLRRRAAERGGDPALRKAADASVGGRAGPLRVFPRYRGALSQVRPGRNAGADAAGDEQLRHAGHRRHGGRPPPRGADPGAGHFQRGRLLPRGVSAGAGRAGGAAGGAAQSSPAAEIDGRTGA